MEGGYGPVLPEHCEWSREVEGEDGPVLPEHCEWSGQVEGVDGPVLVCLAGGRVGGGQ